MRSGIGKAIAGVAAGLAVWIAVVAAAGLIMRSSWPAYASVADAMTFTLPMLLARLSIGALATLAAGWVTTAVAPPRLNVGSSKRPWSRTELYR
jgi:hypothetical protein